MTSPSDLARRCVASGFIPEHMGNDAARAFAKAYETKGEEEVVGKISARAKRSPIRSIGILNAILDEIPDRPPAQPMPKPPTQEEEWDMEEKDRNEALELEKQLAEALGTEPRPMLEPNDPSFDRHPSVFDGPYQGHEEYKKHTFASVYRESRETHVSMHEICRRLGLRYEFLLI